MVQAPESNRPAASAAPRNGSTGHYSVAPPSRFRHYTPGSIRVLHAFASFSPQLRWCTGQDSNLRLAGCPPDALPLSYPCKVAPYRRCHASIVGGLRSHIHLSLGTVLYRVSYDEKSCLAYGWALVTIPNRTADLQVNPVQGSSHQILSQGRLVTRPPHSWRVYRLATRADRGLLFEPGLRSTWWRLSVRPCQASFRFVQQLGVAGAAVPPADWRPDARFEARSVVRPVRPTRLGTCRTSRCQESARR